MSEQWWIPDSGRGPADAGPRESADLPEVRHPDRLSVEPGTPPPVGRGPSRRPVADARGGARGAIAVLLLLATALLAPPAVISVWFDGLLDDRAHYLEVTEDLARDDVVRATVADRATGEVMAALDVDALGSSRLSALATRLGLGETVAEQARQRRSQIREVVRRRVRQLCDQAVRSEAFVGLWQQASGQVYDQVTGVIHTESEADAIARANTMVVRLDMSDLLAPVWGTLAGFGVQASALPTDLVIRMSLDSAAVVRRARGAFSLAESWSRWLPPLCLAMGVGAVLLARRRWRTLGWGSVVVAVPLLMTWPAARLTASIVSSAIGRAGGEAGVSQEVVDRVTEAATSSLIGLLQLCALALLAVAVGAGVASSIIGHRRGIVAR